jgi:hypothetical protein
LSTASIAVPEAFRYIFGAIATRDRRKEAVMDWARILAYVTGTVDQELLARNEYRDTENRILKDAGTVSREGLGPVLSGSLLTHCMPMLRLLPAGPGVDFAGALIDAG